MEIITSLPFNEYDDPIPNFPDQKLQIYILLYNEEIEEPIENGKNKNNKHFKYF